MAYDPNDAEANTFCNQRARPLFDQLARTYYQSKQFVQEWNARGLGTNMPFDDATEINDGSETDGRPPITSIDVNNLLSRASELVTDYEASSSAKLNTVLVGKVND